MGTYPHTEKHYDSGVKDAHISLIHSIIDEDIRRAGFAMGVVEATETGRWTKVLEGDTGLSLNELSTIYKGFQERGWDSRFPSTQTNDVHISGLIGKNAFLKAVYDGDIDPAQLQSDIQQLYDQTKNEKHFFRALFNIIADKNPVERITEDLLELDQFCRDNDISFSEVTKQISPTVKPNSTWQKIKDFRFLLVALVGAGVGLVGNLADVNMIEEFSEHLSAAITTLTNNGLGLGEVNIDLSSIPGTFFGALPYIALPFITLSIFNAFSQKSIFKEIGTFARFTALMGFGVVIGLAVTAGMSDLLPSLEVADAARDIDKSSSFSPAQLILPGIAISALLATVYRKAKEGLSSRFEAIANMKRDYIKTGIDGATLITDKSFMTFINYLGLPAVFTLLALTVNSSGAGELAPYLNFYAALSTSMLAGVGALAGLAYLNGARKWEFGNVIKNASTAFGLSSSAATMPYTKQTLAKIGVPSHVRESVVPLGANFNMFGTALYLGTTAACASVMFGLEPSIEQLAGIMALSVATAFGAPGAPASTIIFLEPVLHNAGLTPLQAEKIYQMVIPIDRPADMLQTSMNVTGDKVVALNTQAYEENKGLRRFIPWTRHHGNDGQDARPAPVI